MDFIEDLITKQMKNQVLSLPHLMEEIAKQKNMEAVTEDMAIQQIE